MDIDKGILKRALHSLKETSGFLFLALAVSNLLTAVKPFIILHFSASIVDGLYKKTGSRQILLWAIEMALCVFCAEVAGYLLKCYVEKCRQAFSYDENLKLTEKNMQMDFQVFESSQVLLEGIRKAKFQRGDPFGILIQSVEDILAGLFAGLASLVYILRFFSEKNAAGIRLKLRWWQAAS